MKSDSNFPERLPKEQVQLIKKFIDEEVMPDCKSLVLDVCPLKDNIFKLIAQKSIVMFYPIKDLDEKNDAFLLQDIQLTGTKVNAIFINTYMTLEKQIFSAAHEYGHLTEVSRYVLKGNCKDHELDERIVNRFAAELLMPDHNFKAEANKLIGKFRDEKGIRIVDLIRVILGLMQEFCVPYNALAIRMYETGILSERIVRLLVDGDASLGISVKELHDTVEKLLSESSEYQNLQCITLQKSIIYKDYDLKDDINEADQLNNIPKVVLSRLRDNFNILHENVDKEVRIDE